MTEWVVPMRTIFVLCNVCVFIAPAFAGDQGEPEKSCDGSTYEMVQCLNAKTAQWDKRMTIAYEAKLKEAQPKQREQLRVAQRLWVKFRDANCLYFDLGEGTIARIDAGDCMVETTKRRAIELEEAGERK
jgi:uncharacterized protein YecT (DUF1311 family)